MKKAVFFVLFFVILFSLTACDKNQAENVVRNDGMPERGMPDFGQPEEKADIVGVVKSIVGNEITILKVERPERDFENQLNDNKKSSDQNKSFSLGGNTGKMPGMGMSKGGTGDDNNEMIEMIKKMSTGEESVIIPVGIRMLKTEASNERPQTALEANLSDVGVDKMINIWLNKGVTDKNVASFVLIK
ncbi:hypothetical protein K8R62_03880 [bacterium]|nr:hypothetical protein [bacterium]